MKEKDLEKAAIAAGVIYLISKSSAVPPTSCTSGATRCDPNDSNVVQKCVGGKWEGWQSCGYGCVEDAFGARCAAVPPTPCTEGATRCDPNDSNVVQ